MIRQLQSVVTPESLRQELLAWAHAWAIPLETEAILFTPDEWEQAGQVVWLEADLHVICESGSLWWLVEVCPASHDQERHDRAREDLEARLTNLGYDFEAEGALGSCLGMHFCPVRWGQRGP